MKKTADFFLQRLQITNTRTRYSSFRIDSIDRAMVLLLDVICKSSAPAARVGERSSRSNLEGTLQAECSYSERKKLCNSDSSIKKKKFASKNVFVALSTLSAIEMTREGRCSNPSEGIDVSKGK